MIGMKFYRVRLRIALVAMLAMAAPGLGRAGGINFGDEDHDSSDQGPSFFGFVREVGGPGIADAKVTASLKQGGALVTRTDIMGVYKIPGFGKEINPEDVVISCAKDGYAEASIDRRPRGDDKDPVETECYLQKK
jgi:hypothetical protein